MTHVLAELNVQLGTSGLGGPGPTKPEVSLLILLEWRVGFFSSATPLLTQLKFASGHRRNFYVGTNFIVISLP